MKKKEVLKRRLNQINVLQNETKKKINEIKSDINLGYDNVNNANDLRYYELILNNFLNEKQEIKDKLRTIKLIKNVLKFILIMLITITFLKIGSENFARKNEYENQKNMNNAIKAGQIYGKEN